MQPNDNLAGAADAPAVVLARADAIGEGEVVQVVVNGKAIAVYHVDGEYYASDDVCNHGQASLAEGYLDGDEIECPLHGGRFNVKTGAPCAPPATRPMKTYRVEVRAGEVVLVDPAELEDA